MSEFDINKIAAAFLSSQVNGIMQSVSGLARNLNQGWRARMESTYSAYIEALLEKHSKIKSVLIKNPGHIYDYYVPVGVRVDNQIICDPDCEKLLALDRNLLITGTAGSGKSMLVKHLVLNSIISRSRLPIFIELRHINDGDENLESLLKKNLIHAQLALDEDKLFAALKKQNLLIFLDGYDEVVKRKRAALGREIRGLSKIFPSSTVILTSRPDQEIESWSNFCVLNVIPLSKELAVELVSKLPFEESLKSKFMKELQSTLYEQRRSFLSNPLLLSIMLLSYGQSASIPNKLSVFYNQAYEALFERHDVQKDGYRRELMSGLDIQDFARLFSAFSLKAYDQRKFEFTHSESLRYIDDAKKLTGIDCERESYFQDLNQAVCLLIQDGIQYVYAHRSFQEYFAARFISECHPDKQQPLLKRYSSQGFSRDNVLQIVHELRPELVERAYMLPELKRLFKSIGVSTVVAYKHHLAFVNQYVAEISLRGDRVRFIPTRHGPFEALHFTLRTCLPLINERFHCSDEQLTKYSSLFEGNEFLSIERLPKTFLRDLADSDSYLSMATLSKALRIQRVLEKKARDGERSLEAILR